jgi:hypothetical protein
MTTASLVDGTGAHGVRTAYASPDAIATVETYFAARAVRDPLGGFRVEVPPGDGHSAMVVRIFVTSFGGSPMVGDRTQAGDVTRIVVESWPAGHPVETSP